jgi:predicted small metal-binding protein
LYSSWLRQNQAHYNLYEEVINIAMTLACRDLGADCPYVARGETEEEVIADGARHAKEVHRYTEEQLKDPEMMKKIKAAIKTE